jgi:uncharacterized protein DUF6868
MTDLKHVLLWCLGLNYAALLAWFLAFALAHDWTYRMNSKFWRLSVEQFDALNWASMAAYKIGILLLNLVPLAAIYLAGVR